MSYFYAEINAQGFLIGVSQLKNSVDSQNLISITETEYGTIMDWFYKAKHVNGEWIEGATQEEIADINQPPGLSELDILGQQLVEKDLQILALQDENQTLGQQLVAMDLRLLAGGL